MEACIMVERDLDKIVKKLKTVSGSTVEKLEKLLRQIEELKATFEQGTYVYVAIICRISSGQNTAFYIRLGNCSDSQVPLTSEQVEMLKELQKSCKEVCQNVSTEHKDVHGAISKFGRAIDKVRE